MIWGWKETGSECCNTSSCLSKAAILSFLTRVYMRVDAPGKDHKAFLWRGGVWVNGQFSPLWVSLRLPWPSNWFLLRLWITSRMSRFSGSGSWLGRTCTNSSIHIQIFSLVLKMDSPCLLGMCLFIRWLETDCKFLRVVALWEGQLFWSKLLQSPRWSKPNPF